MICRNLQTFVRNVELLLLLSEGVDKVLVEAEMLLDVVPVFVLIARSRLKLSQKL